MAKEVKFTKVCDVLPLNSGLMMKLKVLDSKAVIGGVHYKRIAECIVGDETAVIVFKARNEQVALMKPGVTVILHNAKIDMFRDSMRLAVDKNGRIEVVEPETFTVKEDNNMSLIEFETVRVKE